MKKRKESTMDIWEDLREMRAKEERCFQVVDGAELERLLDRFGATNQDRRRFRHLAEEKRRGDVLQQRQDYEDWQGGSS